MAFLSYSVDSDGKHKRSYVDTLPNNKDLNYDDPVDRSTFRPDSEEVRAFHMTGQGSNSNPVYDSDSSDTMPSDLEVLIRSGKLDKAEISQIQQQKAKELEETASENLKKQKLKEVEEVAKARQDYLDKATGFKGSDQTQTS